MVDIDLAALRWNWAQAQSLAAPATRLLPIVKADAYGHGLVAVARELAASGAWGFGVSGLEEALALRAAGLILPVILLLGARPQEAAEVVRAHFTPVIFDVAEAEALNAAAAARGLKQAVHVKVDTGMGRLGFTLPELPAVLARLAAMKKNIDVEGVCSHLAAADLDDAFSREQLGRFQAALEEFRQAGLAPRMHHLANSAAVMGLPDVRLSLARPGVMLYGGYPSEWLRARTHLRPVMSLKARVLQVKTLRRGDTVSYGCTYVAAGSERVAVVGCGYSHGYSRALSGKASVLIGGSRAAVRGRICMNAFMADVTHLPQVATGDEVVLLGTQGEETVSAEELAELAGTISYEIFCAVGGLCRKRLVNHAEERAARDHALSASR
ncbi:MAG: alanine racemase [Pseudomonadota bacterium]